MELTMRKRTQYSHEVKEKLLAKALAPNAPSVIELAKRANIPYSTLLTWIAMSKKNTVITLDPIAMPIRPKDISAENKLKAVSETLSMDQDIKSAYCRNKGFYIHQLEEWKKQFLAGMQPVDIKKDKAECRQLNAEIKDLKRELNRKDKALAEASALLILKKKANLLWGDGEDD